MSVEIVFFCVDCGMASATPLDLDQHTAGDVRLAVKDMLVPCPQMPGRFTLDWAISRARGESDWQDGAKREHYLTREDHVKHAALRLLIATHGPTQREFARRREAFREQRRAKVAARGGKRRSALLTFDEEGKLQ